MGHDAAYTFHATLASAASLVAVVTILNRYYDRPTALPPGPITLSDAPAEAAPAGASSVQGAQPAPPTSSELPPDDNGEDQ